MLVGNCRHFLTWHKGFKGGAKNEKEEGKVNNERIDWLLGWQKRVLMLLYQQPSIRLNQKGTRNGSSGQADILIIFANICIPHPFRSIL